jgi:circadian clock protein KaiC
LTLVLGNSGAGKTILALQFLVSAARRGEPVLFVSFTGNPATLLESAGTFGWDLAEMEKQRLALLLSCKPSSLSKVGWPDLGRALATLCAKAGSIGARRIILDGLDRWLPAKHHPMSALEKVYRIRDWLYENQLACLVTMNLGGQAAGLVQLAADCTIWLRESHCDEKPLRHLCLAKRRGAAVVEEELPFLIGTAGIELLVPRRSTTEPSGRVATASSGEIALARGQLMTKFQNLDHFLELKQAELDFRLAQQALIDSSDRGTMS